MAISRRIKLLDAVTAVGKGDWKKLKGERQTIQAWLANASIVDEDAVVEIHATNDRRAETDPDNAQYVVLGTITIAHDGETSDAFVNTAAWAYIRAEVTTINNGAQVTAQANEDVA